MLILLHEIPLTSFLKNRVLVEQYPNLFMQKKTIQILPKSTFIEFLPKEETSKITQNQKLKIKIKVHDNAQTNRHKNPNPNVNVSTKVEIVKLA
jgi:hypothetical protein